LLRPKHWEIQDHPTASPKYSLKMPDNLRGKVVRVFKCRIPAFDKLILCV
jgi:hypothetical protein